MCVLRFWFDWLRYSVVIIMHAEILVTLSLKIAVEALYKT